nr:hypothetical protein [Candidatus Sigynarchaeota archaeon]
MDMKTLVRFRTLVNVIWGKPINGKEAFAFIKGFPATFILTQRRAIVVAEFLEKQGWFHKKAVHRLCFEARLDKVKEYKLEVFKERRIVSAIITFHPHGDIGETGMIQFLRMSPDVWPVIERHLATLDIKKPVEDGGIVLVDGVDPRAWIKDRYDLD